jgi:glycosyltransferase involved in cell wall biosynthesis
MEKRELFTGLDMTIVTPSSWLKDLVKQSFLKDYPVEVINNGIDLTIFKPTQSDFRKRFDLQDKKIILGVSFDWGDRKGLGDFVKLATTLGDDYKVILVGTDESVVAQVPKNIFCINVTQNKRELAEIYSTADVFVNPTREDTFPTVNLEALACGTPVVTYQTGGSPESITDKCGRVVPYEDYEALRDAVVEICTEQVIDRSDCVLRAQNYNKEDKFTEYVKLYDRIDA